MKKQEDGPAGQSGVGDFAVGGSDYFDDQPAAVVAGVRPNRPAAGAGTTVDDGEGSNTISVENPAGGFVLVNQGSGFVVEGYEEVASSSINVNNLTANFTSLQAKRLLLSQEELTPGSSNEQLEQYGLDNPQYSIQIVTTDGQHRRAVFR